MLMAKSEREALIPGTNCGISEVAYYLPQSSDEAMIQHLVKVFPPPEGNNQKILQPKQLFQFFGVTIIKQIVRVNISLHMQSGGKYGLLQYYCWSRLYSLESEMPLLGDPSLRSGMPGRSSSQDFSLFSGSQEKQHLLHKEPTHTEKGEAGHVEDPCLRVQNNSALPSSCFPMISYMIMQGLFALIQLFWLPTCRLTRQAENHGSGSARMRAPSPLAASQPFHLLRREKQTYPLNIPPSHLSSIFKARTSLWEKKPHSSTHKKKFYSLPCLKPVHVNCPVGYVFVAELT